MKEVGDEEDENGNEHEESEPDDSDEGGDRGGHELSVEYSKAGSSMFVSLWCSSFEGSQP